MTSEYHPSAPIVRVTYTAAGWRADIPALHTYWQQQSLSSLDRDIRDLLGAYPNEWVDYEFNTGRPDLDRLIGQARACRRAATMAERRAREYTDAVIEAAEDLSHRDLAVLLGLSHQRVTQLRKRPDPGNPDS